MQKLIVLGGNSSKNLEWGAAVGAAYGSWFDEVYVQPYDHWATGEELINFPREIEKLHATILADGVGAEHTVIAKSFGTVLTLMAVAERALEPVRCVFFGMPLNLVAEQDLFAGDWSVLGSFTPPTLAIHKVDDPVADLAFLEAKLAELAVTNIELLTLPGESHAYTDLEAYRPHLARFLERS